MFGPEFLPGTRYLVPIYGFGDGNLSLALAPTNYSFENILMELNPKISREKAVLVIRNNNPRLRNAFTPEFMEGVRAALNIANVDTSIGAVVLAGVGQHFCAGGDLRSLQARRVLSRRQREVSLTRLNEMILAIHHCKKPVIAAVEGYAVGAGFALALACDLIVAATDATFKASYVAIGLTPDGGTTASLAASLPRQLINQLCMTGDPIGARRLNALGVVNLLADPGGAYQDALTLANRLGNGPSRAICRIKQLNISARQASFADQLQVEARLMAESMGDSESGEGISAFLDKREADFTNCSSTSSGGQ